MTFTEFLSIIFLVVIPIIILAVIVGTIICLITENRLIQFLADVFIGCLMAFGVINWIEFCVNHGWM